MFGGRVWPAAAVGVDGVWMFVLVGGACGAGSLAVAMSVMVAGLVDGLFRIVVCGGRFDAGAILSAMSASCAERMPSRP